ncbi:MAG: response regulator [bacterium]
MAKTKVPKVVIIDDEQDICSLVRMALEPKGYSISEAYDGESGLELIKTKKPDLVICDIKMPKMNGYEVIMEMRTNQAYPPNIPIIVMTSLTSDSDRSDEQWREGLHVAAFFTKPFEVQELASQVEKALTSSTTPS